MATCFAIQGRISAAAGMFESLYAGMSIGAADADAKGWFLTSFSATLPAPVTGAALSTATAYDAGSTTFTMAMGGSDFAKMVVPLNLQVVANLQSMVTAGSLAMGKAFSVQFGGTTYRGLYGARISGSPPANLEPAFFFQDTTGVVTSTTATGIICAVDADTSAGLNVRGGECFSPGLQFSPYGQAIYTSATSVADGRALVDGRSLGWAPDTFLLTSASSMKMPGTYSKGGQYGSFTATGFASFRV